jgi:hypothetical protein
MTLAFALLDLVEAPAEAPRLWGAVYLHDVARTHDGRCHQHGTNAIKRLDELPDTRALFRLAGIRPEDDEAVATAVKFHSLPEELMENHPHRRLTALLKDADGLDRVRLGDLDPYRLRFPVSRTLVGFARVLYEKTQYSVVPGRTLFPSVWEVAQTLWPRHSLRI